MMFKNGNGGTSVPVVASVGISFKLGGNAGWMWAELHKGKNQ